MSVSFENNVLVSIIVPVYNVEKYLKDCLYSVLTQSYINIEVILIDDGSTDNSGAICNEYELIDNRIKVIHQENKGLSCARNVGINMAKGEYIAFVDADDILNKNYILFLYKTCVDNEVKISMCKRQEFVNSSDVVSNSKEDYSGSIHSSFELQNWLYNKNRSHVIYCWNKLFHRSVFDNLRFPEGKVFENSYFTPRALDSADKVFCLDNVLYYYRQVPNGLSKSINGDKYLDLIWCLEETKKFYLKNNNDELYKTLMKFILNKCIDLYFYCYRYLKNDAGYHNLIKIFKEKYRDYYTECCNKHVFKGVSERIKYFWKLKLVIRFMRNYVLMPVYKCVKKLF